MDANEQSFAEERQRLHQKIANANAELADAIMEGSYSPRVAGIVEKIHMAQSDLEKATLEHIFSMKSVLTPEQFQQMLSLTSQALNTPDRP